MNRCVVSRVHRGQSFLFTICFMLGSFAIAMDVDAQKPEIGIVSSMSNDSVLHASGYRALVENTQRILSPLEVTDDEFHLHLEEISELQTPLLATNIFIPASMKVVGPEVDEQKVLGYVEAVFQRARQAGVHMIIWGSGGSRQIPPGFDREEAKKQFVTIARQIAVLAGHYDIVLALENLNRSEANFINSVKEAAEIAEAVDHKNLRVCADMYHMLREREAPEDIEAAGKFIIYAEVAEREERTPPGVRGDDFRKYLEALKHIGFKGKIVIECRWQDIGYQASEAYRALSRQIDDVF